MSGRVVVRGAGITDAPAVAAVIAAAFAEYRGRLVPESAAFGETAEAVARELRTGSGALVAESAGESSGGGGVLGCVMVKPQEGDLYLGRLAVPPHARRRGIARRLVAAVEAEAARRGLAGVRLAVRIALPANQRMFGALGYVETSREAHPGFDRPTSISMRKALG